MPRRPPVDRPKKRLTHHRLMEDFGEESVPEEEDFQSVSTDNEITNYSLDYTSQSLKSQKPKNSQNAKETPKKATPLKSALRSSAIGQGDASTSERSRNSSAQQSASSRREPTIAEITQTRSRSSKNTRPVRLPEVEDEDSETEEEEDSETQEEEEPQASRRPTRTAYDSPQTRRTKNVAKEQPSTSEQQNQSKQRTRKQKQPKSRSHILKEIRRLQQAVNLLIPKLSFSRVIREILMQYSEMQMRITLVAFQALQEAAELYLVQLFEDSYRCTIHRGRVTLTVKDMELVRFLRGPCDPGNN